MPHSSRSRVQYATDIQPCSAERAGPSRREQVMAVLARLWRAFRLLWLVMIACAVLIEHVLALSIQQVPSVTNWSIFQPLPINEFPVSPVDVAAVLTFSIYLSYLLLSAAHRWATAAEYVHQSVRRLEGRNYVPRYVASVYVPRRDVVLGPDADFSGWAALHRAATRRNLASPREPLGICVFGPPMQGKTRLAWEVMRAELSSWTFVRWPHEPHHPFNFSAHRGKRVVLWLDDLHEYANDHEGDELSDLPRRFASAGARVVVVATCRNGADETSARRYIGGLMQRLTPIHPAAITGDEADQLAAALAKVGVAAQRDEFDGTPGSLLLNIRRMRTEIYPALPEPARLVLSALKLLRSARLYTYPASRVYATAVEVLGLAEADWYTGVGAAVNAGLVRLRILGWEGLYFIEPVSTVYLQRAIPYYLNRNAEISDDWPYLQETFERQRDACALISLGNAFADLSRLQGPLLLYNQEGSNQQAILCFHAALETFTRRATPDAWAATQHDLGSVFLRQARRGEGVAHAALLRQAATAYRAALEVYTRQSTPTHWATAHTNLAQVYWLRAEQSAYAGEITSSCDMLMEARKCVDCTLTVYTPAFDPARYEAASALQHKIDDTLRDLGGEVELEPPPHVSVQAQGPVLYF